MLKEIHINKLYSKGNIRQEADDTIRELANSIRQHGLISPLLVQEDGNGKYEIIAGHRRYLALKLAMVDIVSCNVITEDEAVEGKDRVLVQIAENVQRKNMSAWELVDVFNSLKAKYRMTQAAIARYLGKSEMWVSQQYTAAAILEAQYGKDIPEAEKKKTASQISYAHKSKASGSRSRIFGNGFSVKKSGHSYNITCENFEVEQSLIKWIDDHK